jgi:hypothetical protein
MALSGDVMAANIVTAINGLSDADKQDLTKVWKAIAGQIVTHVKTANVAVPAAGLLYGTTPITGAATGSLT